ncbi:MAG: nitrous oxide reductase family maturation protein NosD [Promethearchaeota archaeon]
MSIVIIEFIFIIGFLCIHNFRYFRNFGTKFYPHNEETIAIRISGTYENITIDNLPGSWNNWEWAKNQVWCSGLGTYENPYVIQGHTIGIDNTLDGIKISNSHGIYFIIKDSSFIWDGFMRIGMEVGIMLSNSTLGTIINNTFQETSNGINVNDCKDLIITNNTVYNMWGGITLIQSDFCEISENIINKTENGIGVTNCANNTVKNNKVYDSEYGIYVSNSQYNDIFGNIANDNNIAGIFLGFSDNNNITDNTARNNIDGVFLEDDCDNNFLMDNNFSNNEIGIQLYYSDINNITKNIANKNSDYGIRLEGSSLNTITENSFNNNTLYGMFLHTMSHNNEISGNTINNNLDSGIYLDDDSDYNDIIDNILKNNNQGIYLYTDCANNSIYKNSFLENGIHAVDDGTDNEWNSTTIGNYWDNHTGPDDNNDGIVDIPYIYIGGIAGSIDYLPIAEELAPGGLDPGVIAVIVMISVIGGVVLLGVVLVLLEKKGKISFEKIKGYLSRRK